MAQDHQGLLVAVGEDSQPVPTLGDRQGQVDGLAVEFGRYGRGGQRAGEFLRHVGGGYGCIVASAAAVG